MLLRLNSSRMMRRLTAPAKTGTQTTMPIAKAVPEISRAVRPALLRSRLNEMERKPRDLISPHYVCRVADQAGGTLLAPRCTLCFYEPNGYVAKQQLAADQGQYWSWYPEARHRIHLRSRPRIDTSLGVTGKWQIGADIIHKSGGSRATASRPVYLSPFSASRGVCFSIPLPN